MNKAGKIGIALLCLIAIGLSLWLTIEKLSGRINSLAGCGTGSGCANVLGSKWSVVFGSIPISAFSLVLYLGILLSLASNSQLIRSFRVLAAWLCIWAAIWFTGLQFFILQTICPYCLTMHGIGIALGISLLFLEKKLSCCAMILGSCMVSGLALIQHYGPTPATHQLEDSSTTKNSKTADIYRQRLSQDLPRIGSPQAKHVIIKYFDYTCTACKEVHDDLATLMEQYPDQIAVILLPVPLNNMCNPHLPNGAENHSNACEFAKLALKVWNGSPESFEEFHHQLFELSDIPLEAAEAMADSLITDGPSDEQWIKDTIQLCLEDYKTFSETTHVMPKLLLPGPMLMQGKAIDRETFEKIVKEQLHFK
ncbi:MAG: vitamin K epoxide reductase family protein [Akkermansiaceae bacterium]